MSELIQPPFSSSRNLKNPIESEESLRIARVANEFFWKINRSVKEEKEEAAKAKAKVKAKPDEGKKEEEEEEEEEKLLK